MSEQREPGSWSELLSIFKTKPVKELRICTIPYSSEVNLKEMDYAALCSINGISVESLQFLKELLQRAYLWPDPTDEFYTERNDNFKQIIVPAADGSFAMTSISFERKLGSKDIEVKLRTSQTFKQYPFLNLISDNSAPAQELFQLIAKHTPGVYVANRSNTPHAIDGVAALLSIMPETLTVSSRSGLDSIEELVNRSGQEPIIFTTDNRDPIEALLSLIGRVAEKPALKAKLLPQLKGVVLHDRVKRSCKSCARSTTIDSHLMKRVPEVFHSLLPGSYLFGRGCDLCCHSSYRGTMGLSSMAVIHDQERKLLAADIIDIEALTRSCFKYGTRPLISHGFSHIVNGQTSFEEVLKVAGSVSTTFTKVIASETTQPHSAKKSAPHILLVEDNEDQRMVIETMFSAAGYEVTTSTDGIDALNQLKHRTADLIVCDLMMPKMNGVQFVNSLRENGSWKRIPVLILTAATNPDLEASLIKSGASDYCEKNVTRKVLLARVERLLRS